MGPMVEQVETNARRPSTFSTDAVNYISVPRRSKAKLMGSKEGGRTSAVQCSAFFDAPLWHVRPLRAFDKHWS